MKNDNLLIKSGQINFLRTIYIWLEGIFKWNITKKNAINFEEIKLGVKIFEISFIQFWQMGEYYMAAI